MKELIKYCEDENIKIEVDKNNIIFIIDDSSKRSIINLISLLDVNFKLYKASGDIKVKIYNNEKDDSLYKAMIECLKELRGFDEYFSLKYHDLFRIYEEIYKENDKFDSSKDVEVEKESGNEDIVFTCDKYEVVNSVSKKAQNESSIKPDSLSVNVLSYLYSKNKEKDNEKKLIKDDKFSLSATFSNISELARHIFEKSSFCERYGVELDEKEKVSNESIEEYKYIKEKYNEIRKNVEEKLKEDNKNNIDNNQKKLKASDFSESQIKTLKRIYNTIKDKKGEEEATNYLKKYFTDEEIEKIYNAIGVKKEEIRERNINNNEDYLDSLLDKSSNVPEDSFMAMHHKKGKSISEQNMDITIGLLNKKNQDKVDAHQENVNYSLNEELYDMLDEDIEEDKSSYGRK